MRPLSAGDAECAVVIAFRFVVGMFLAVNVLNLDIAPDFHVTRRFHRPMIDPEKVAEAILSAARCRCSTRLAAMRSPRLRRQVGGAIRVVARVFIERGVDRRRLDEGD